MMESAFAIIDASDFEIRNECAKLIRPVVLASPSSSTSSTGDNAQGDSKDKNESTTNAAPVPKVRADDIHALLVLCSSNVPVLRDSALSALESIADNGLVPTGKLTNKDILTRISDILSKVKECQDDQQVELLIFSINIASSLAKKGSLWQDRLIQSNWLDNVLNVLDKQVNAKAEELMSMPENEIIHFIKEFTIVESVLKLLESFSFHELSKSSVKLEVIAALLGTISRIPLIPFHVATSDHFRMLHRCGIACTKLLQNDQFYSPDLIETFKDSTLRVFLRLAFDSINEYFKIQKELNLRLQIQNKQKSTKHSRTQSSQSHSHDSTAELIYHASQLIPTACDALNVVRVGCMGSKDCAQATADVFEEYNAMVTLNLLYRSQVEGSKLCIAQFLEALVRNVDTNRQSMLCENGIIIRLLRLASPSAVNVNVSSKSANVYESPSVDESNAQASAPNTPSAATPGGGNNNAASQEFMMTPTSSLINSFVSGIEFTPQASESSDENAFIPALSAIATLAQTPSIAARLILAGGLGVLYSHANSSKGTRKLARDALEAIGITNIQQVIHLFSTLHNNQNEKAKDLANAQDLATTATISADEQAAVANKSPFEKAQETMSKWILANGEPLIMPMDQIRSPDTENPGALFDAKYALGSGAFSTVYRAAMRKRGQVSEQWIDVAAKRLNEKASFDSEFMSEIRILTHIPEHPNICALYGVIMDDGRCTIVTELGGPTLSKLLCGDSQDCNNFQANWTERLEILLDIAEGIKHLHSLAPAILHLDLKSSNILVRGYPGKQAIAQLCDFGLAVELIPGYEFLAPANHGTLQWMAPECFDEPGKAELSYGFDQTADTFSFAIVMWELAHPRRVPWDELMVDGEDIQMKIRQMVKRGQRPTCSGTSEWPEDYESLMRLCWRPKPSERPLFASSFLSDPDTEFNQNSLSSSQSITSSLKMIINKYKKKMGMNTSAGNLVERRLGMKRNLSVSYKYWSQ